MYLIDTDVIIWVLRGNKKYIDLLQEIKYTNPLAISTITIAEVYKNIYPAEILRTENLFKEMETLDVTPEIAKQGGLYWQQYTKQLKNLSLTDCLIAATAHIHEATLVTL